MRHVNRPTYSNYHGEFKGRINAPTDCNYTFTWVIGTKYFEVLKYIFKNPGCKRLDIINAVWPRRINMSKSANRGFSSNLFSNMLYADLIDYNNKFEYVVGKRGLMLLAEYDN